VRFKAQPAHREPGCVSRSVIGLSQNKTKAHVLCLNNDNESCNFAQEVFETLRDAGWNLLDNMVRPILPQGKRLPPGVRIGFHGDIHPDNDQVEISDTTLEGKVIMLLQRAHVKGLYVNSRPDIPEGSLEFLVSSNPDNHN
jgi:hypothetical protein